MKLLIAMVVTSALFGQQPQRAAPKPEHELAGDDIRGYSDTPQLPDQKWKVHDMERPRPQKVTPAAAVRGGAAVRCHRPF